jgi:hypothetical protein
MFSSAGRTNSRSSTADGTGSDPRYGGRRRKSKRRRRERKRKRAYEGRKRQRKRAN